jgi:hypothetical protein
MPVTRGEQSEASYADSSGVSKIEMRCRTIYAAGQVSYVEYTNFYFEPKSTHGSMWSQDRKLIEKLEKGFRTDLNGTQ